MNLTHIPWRICANFLSEGFQKLLSDIHIYIHTYIHTYIQTDRQTDTTEIIYHATSQMVRNSNQHSAYAANLSTSHSGSLQVQHTVYWHGMMCKLAISCLSCVTINCLTIGDHVKMLLT